MKAIAAVDLNWGIGYRGDLLVKIPDDLKKFKNLTLNKIVVMGRKTFESLPGRQPLGDRENIVITARTDFKPAGVITCHSLEELLARLSAYPPDDLWVIGGESLFNQILPYCQEAYITKIECALPADRHLKNLDELTGWVLASEGENHNYQGLNYKTVRYINRNPLVLTGRANFA